MAGLSVLYPLCLPELPGVAEPTLDSAIRRAWIEFAEKSLCWSDFQSITLQAGVSTYALVTPNGARVATVMDALYAGRCLDAISIDALISRDAAFQERSGTPGYYYLTTAGEIALYPKPAAEDVAVPLVVRTAYAAKLVTQTIPDAMAEKYGEFLAAGAKSRLMAMPGATWSNPQLSSYYGNVFSIGIFDATVERAKSGTMAASFVRPRSFG